MDLGAHRPHFARYVAKYRAPIVLVFILALMWRKLRRFFPDNFTTRVFFRQPPCTETKKKKRDHVQRQNFFRQSRVYISNFFFAAVIRALDI
jgi:hypothetical protein